MNEKVSDGELPPEQEREIGQSIAELGELTAEAENVLNSLGWSDLALIPVHGDYHQFNCRFEGDEVAAVVDFDNSRLEPRLYDIVYALHMMLGLGWQVEAEKEPVWSRARLLEPALIEP
jgi:Ser/Thr protein kinase RdoA (MazF antagonist)